jgi:WD40 repeat protein
MIIYFLIATAPCNAMKTNNNIIAEINTIKDPRCARYLTGERVAISDRHGAVHIVDLKTKKVQRISVYGSLFTEKIILHNDKKKIITCEENVITIFNEKTGKKERIIREEGGIKSFILNPSKATDCVYYVTKVNKRITRYNCVANKYDHFPCSDECQVMAIHPNQEIVCVSDWSKNIFLCKLDNLKVFKAIFLDNPNDHCTFCQYSPDGSYIAAGNETQVFIIDPEIDASNYPCIEIKEDEVVRSIAFHPYCSVLAILSARSVAFSRSNVRMEHIVRYWNIKTLKLVGTMLKFSSDASYDFTFSDNGDEFIVTLKDKCLRGLVSFTGKEECIHSLLVLNRFKDSIQLPDDVKRYILGILLDTFRV